ncbi:glycosyltransferase family 4 protein [Desulfovibrio subterraneus]|uniref:glycosyltransferase family 4 protein n=1 Tax=Desulfovibrio subterraneus TaxID=2718620 RepID=UPI0022B9384B|nr:glycosyltransferase family 4 protein [Desulfovibrio subterraneus]WBF69009.1 glycosyltransferase family 4 protein [Desulfovibrio subterraneus]
MKILHILSQRPEQTGSGVYITQMMRQAHAAGHENALLAGVPDRFNPPAHEACATSFFVRFGKDLPHDVAGMSDVMPYPSVRFRDLSDAELNAYEACFAMRMQEAVNTFRPDIIHVNHLWLAASLARRLFPSHPVMASSHGSDLRQFRTNPHLRPRVLAGCRGLDAVCALHEMQRRDICELYGISPDKVHVTGAGYDEELFSCAVREPLPPVRICYAGKLSAAKGVPWLLRAVESLAGNDVRLDLCGSGSGDEQAAILRHAEALGGRVVVHGNLNHQALAQVMQQAHIFVLPSMFEGLPLVMLEALACGCRLVSTRLPGVEEAFAGLPETVLRMVELPHLHGADTPVADDEPAFTAALADALCEMVRLTRAEEHPPVSGEVTAVLDRYTWRAVFKRVDICYTALVNKKTNIY